MARRIKESVRINRVCILLTGLLLFSLLAACGDDGGSDNPASDAGDTGVESGQDSADGSDDADSEGGEDTTADATAELDEVCEAGAEEGEFSYWATFTEENFVQIQDAFAETYPGIDIELLPLRPQEAVQRILTEVSSGSTPDVDLLNGQLDVLHILVEREIADVDYDWTALGIPDDLVHDTNMVRIYRVPLGLAYNTDLTDPDELPDTWEELVDEQYAGELVVDPRGNPFREMSVLWGEDETVDYVQRLEDTVDPITIEGGTAGMLSVLNGEYMMTASGRDDSKAELQAEGAPIDLKYLDVIPTTDFYNLLMDEAANKNAAACFAGWLMTEEGQRIHEEVEFKANESVPPTAPEGAEVVSLETSEEAEAVARVADEITAIFTSN